MDSPYKNYARPMTAVTVEYIHARGLPVDESCQPWLNFDFRCGIEQESSLPRTARVPEALRIADQLWLLQNNPLE